jgi:hypothetical protein
MCTFCVLHQTQSIKRSTGVLGRLPAGLLACWLDKNKSNGQNWLFSQALHCGESY